MCRRRDEKGNDTEKEERGKDAQHHGEREHRRQASHRRVDIASSTGSDLDAESCRHVCDRKPVPERTSEGPLQIGRVRASALPVQSGEHLGDAASGTQGDGSLVGDGRPAAGPMQGPRHRARRPCAPGHVEEEADDEDRHERSGDDSAAHRRRTDESKCSSREGKRSEEAQREASLGGGDAQFPVQGVTIPQHRGHGVEAVGIEGVTGHAARHEVENPRVVSVRPRQGIVHGDDEGTTRSNPGTDRTPRIVRCGGSEIPQCRVHGLTGPDRAGDLLACIGPGDQDVVRM